MSIWHRQRIGENEEIEYSKTLVMLQENTKRKHNQIPSHPY